MVGKDKKNKTVLVTGGAGFIGSNFIHYWLKNNPKDKIINLDKLTYAGNLRNLDGVAKNKNYSFVKGDICDFNLVNRILKKGVDLIVNFAAESHVDRSISNSDEFIKTNIVGTHILLEAARVNRLVRFHHVSTDEVFGSLKPGDVKFNEQTPYDPRSPYSASKASSDHLVRAYFHTYRLPVTISNCSNNHGPYQYPEKLIPLAITNILTGKNVPVYGQGDNVRDWIFVDDHVRGIEAVIKAGKFGETYCLGGDCEVTNLEIVREILSLMGEGQDRIDFVKDRPGHDFRYAIDYKKAKRELGFSPLTDFSSGIQITIDWYKKNVRWWKK